nr:DUF6262 family protein [uncultured Blautia sp.]
MKKDNSLPQGLVNKQELQRQQTINKVLRACADIKDEGKIVTIATLVEYTGLSRSTFAKPHIRELLAEHGHAQTGGANAKESGKKPGNKKTSNKDRLIAELRARNTELERECELLRGRLFLESNKCH